MEIIRGQHNIQARHRGCVATIGNFDGVHRGHQAVLQTLHERGAALGLPSLLVTFEPYPQEVLRPDPAIARLTRFREKMLALAATGLDRVLCLRFNRQLAALEPEDFIREILVSKLGVQHLVVGDDFRFGKKRRGDFAMLGRFGAELGFGVEATATVMIDQARVSSTRVRETLARGEMGAVRTLLGRAYCMMGRVRHGDQRGRTLGFPTANIALHRRSTPLNGVYAVTVDGIATHALAGIANIGTRPTVDGRSAWLEVHLFDFNADLYGRCIQVNFEKFIRAEQKFSGLDALQQQIARDCEQARQFHNSSRAN